MSDLANSIQGRVAKIHVGRRHIDLRTQHTRAFVKIASRHLPEQLPILFGGATPPRAIPARLRQRAAQRTNLSGGLIVYISLALLDEQ